MYDVHMMYMLHFYVPSPEKEKVKKALFAEGAGKIGNYQNCCFEFPGTGQFMPLAGSNPHIGSQGKIEYVNEYKVEMVVEGNIKDKVEKALLASHPYETPAYHFVCVT